MLGYIRHNKLIPHFSIHKVHIIHFRNRFYPMGLLERMSFITIDIEDFRFRDPIFSENYFLYHHRPRNRRHLSLLSIISVFEEDDIRQYAEEQYLRHGEKSELKTDLGRRFELTKRP